MKVFQIRSRKSYEFLNSGKEFMSFLDSIFLEEKNRINLIYYANHAIKFLFVCTSKIVWKSFERKVGYALLEIDYFIRLLLKLNIEIEIGAGFLRLFEVSECKLGRLVYNTDSQPLSCEGAGYHETQSSFTGTSI